MHSEILTQSTTCAWQERWAEPGAELAASRPRPGDAESTLSPARSGDKAGSGDREEACGAKVVGGAKRFLPFSAGPRQCAHALLIVAPHLHSLLFMCSCQCGMPAHEQTKRCCLWRGLRSSMDPRDSTRVVGQAREVTSTSQMTCAVA